MQLTDTQRALLEAAAKHPQKKLVDFPENLKGGARMKVISAMINTQLIEVCNDEPNVYMASEAGMQAIGIATQPATPVMTHAARTTREGTKQAVLIDQLKRPEGATLSQMTKATNWQVHTVRGAMAGALKKKLGLEITSEKQPGTDRIYRITTTTV